MAEKLTFHVSAFSDKVRTMNQTNSKSLTMSADDARNLHTEIFTLLAKLADSSSPKEEVTEIKLDGGQFNA